MSNQNITFINYQIGNAVVVMSPRHHFKTTEARTNYYRFIPHGKHNTMFHFFVLNEREHSRNYILFNALDTNHKALTLS